MTVGGRYEIATTELQPGTFDGRHLGLQRAIQVHVLGRNRNTNMVVLERMNRLPEQRRRMVIDAGEHEGLTYVVTWPLDGGRSLIQWLGDDQERAAPATPPPSPALSPPAAAPVAPPPEFPSEAPMGEFTRMFSGRSSGRVPADPLAPNPLTPPPVERPIGEFTRMFSAPPGASSPAKPAAPPPPPLPPPPAVERTPERAAPEGPSEFTRFFSPDVAAAKEEPPPFQLGKPSEPLGFTQVFRRALEEPVRHRDLPPPLPDPPPAMDRPPAPPPLSGATLPGPPAAAGTSDYTRVIGGPRMTVTAPPFPAKPPITLPPLPKPSVAMPPLPKPAAPLPPAQIPAATGGFPLIWLVGILAALAVFAVVLIVIMVLMNR